MKYNTERIEYNGALEAHMLGEFVIDLRRLYAFLKRLTVEELEQILAAYFDHQVQGSQGGGARQDFVNMARPTGELKNSVASGMIEEIRLDSK